MASGSGFSGIEPTKYLLGSQIVVVDPGHTLLLARTSGPPCPLDLLRSLLSGSDPESFDAESRSTGALERWGLPAEGRRFGFGGPRFLAPQVDFVGPDNRRLALVSCGCFGRVQRLNILENAVRVRLTVGQTYQRASGFQQDDNGRCAPSSPPRLVHDQRFRRRTTAEREPSRSGPRYCSCENCPPEPSW